MHVGNTPAVVAEAQALRPQPGAQKGSPHQDGPHGSASSGGGVSGLAKTMHPHSAPLASETLGATIAAQADGGEEIEGEGAGETGAARGRSGETPAARARALLESDPSLAERPFGHIVSALARGLEVGAADAEALDGEQSPEPEAAAEADPEQAIAEGDEAADGELGIEDQGLEAPIPELAADDALAQALEEMLEAEDEDGDGDAGQGA